MTVFYGLTIIILSCLNVLLCFCIVSPLQLNLLFRTQGRPRKLKFSASKRQVEDKGRGSAQEGPQCPSWFHQHLPLVFCDHRLNSGALALSSPPLKRSTCPSLPRILPVLTPGELKEFVHLLTMLVEAGTSTMTGTPGQSQNCPQQVQLSLHGVGCAPGQQLPPKHRVRLLPQHLAVGLLSPEHLFSPGCPASTWTWCGQYGWLV